MLANDFINSAQAELATANANAKRTSELVNDANKIANAALQAAIKKKNNNAEWIKNSADENSTVKYLLNIGAKSAFNRVKDLEYKVGEVATVGSKRNQDAADRVTAAEETVRLLEEQKQFYENKLAKQWYKRILDELKQHHDLSRS